MKVVLYPSRQQALYITYEQISNDRSILDNLIQRLGFEDKIRKKKKSYNFVQWLLVMKTQTGLQG